MFGDVEVHRITEASQFPSTLISKKVRPKKEDTAMMMSEKLLDKARTDCKIRCAPSLGNPENSLLTFRKKKTVAPESPNDFLENGPQTEEQ